MVLLADWLDNYIETICKINLIIFVFALLLYVSNQNR